jgi:hypothetical protein
MPFDALVAPPRPKLLAEILQEHALAPISWEALAEHKQAQLDKFTPSFWHSHQTLLPVFLLGSVGCMASTGGLANGLMSPGSLLPSYLTLAWIGVIGLLIMFGVFRAHAGSYWDERYVVPGALDSLGVPSPIAALARQLHRAAPGSALVLGELKQEAVVLDPYLLLIQDTECVCLGIWDGDRIIACAG